VPVEIEIKLKVEDPTPVREKLRALGAQPRGKVLETNIFFDTSDRALLAADCGLRLRRSRSLNGGGETLILTYKGPRAEGPVKQREEIEVTVDATDATKLLLERLGYTEQLCFEKRRESWKVGKCEIELDELPRLGMYVEIEGPSEEEVTDLQRRLGLSSLAAVAPTYADLVARHLNDIGEPGKRLVFTS
jgi:adenylate cyclase class 2